MAEKYVNVSALRELLGIESEGDCEKCEHHRWNRCYNDELIRACEAIDDAPEADVRPVVRASFVSASDGYGICSNCNRGDHIDPLARFCRFCGADMREVVE